MDALGALSLKAAGNGDGIVVVDRHLVFPPLDKSHAAAIFEVNRGYDDHASIPFVDNTPLMRASRATASRSALPVALNAASMTWWALPQASARK